MLTAATILLCLGACSIGFAYWNPEAAWRPWGWHWFRKARTVRVFYVAQGCFLIAVAVLFLVRAMFR